MGYKETFTLCKMFCSITRRNGKRQKSGEDEKRYIMSYLFHFDAAKLRIFSIPNKFFFHNLEEQMFFCIFARQQQVRIISIPVYSMKQ